MTSQPRSIEELKALPVAALIQNGTDWIEVMQYVAEHLNDQIQADSLLRKALAINRSGPLDELTTEPDYYIRSQFLMNTTKTIGEQFDQALAHSLKELVVQENGVLAKMCDLMASQTQSVMECDRIAPMIVHEMCRKASLTPCTLVCGSYIYEQVRSLSGFVNPSRAEVIIGTHHGLLNGFVDGPIKVLTDTPDYRNSIDSRTAYLLPTRNLVGILNLRSGLELRTLDYYPEAKLEAGWFCSQVQSCRINPSAVMKVVVN